MSTPPSPAATQPTTVPTPPISRGGARAAILSRLAAQGRSPDFLDDGALTRLIDHAHGSPRVLRAAVDATLAQATREAARHGDAALVGRALAGAGPVPGAIIPARTRRALWLAGAVFAAASVLLIFLAPLHPAGVALPPATISPAPPQSPPAVLAQAPEMPVTAAPPMEPQAPSPPDHVAPPKAETAMNDQPSAPPTPMPSPTTPSPATAGPSGQQTATNPPLAPPPSAAPSVQAAPEPLPAPSSPATDGRDSPVTTPQPQPTSPPVATAPELVPAPSSPPTHGQDAPATAPPPPPPAQASTPPSTPAPQQAETVPKLAPDIGVSAPPLPAAPVAADPPTALVLYTAGAPGVQQRLNSLSARLRQAGIGQIEKRAVPAGTALGRPVSFFDRGDLALAQRAAGVLASEGWPNLPVNELAPRMIRPRAALRQHHVVIEIQLP